MPKGNEVISLFALEQKANELILMLHVGWREAGEKPHATHVEGEEQNIFLLKMKIYGVFKARHIRIRICMLNGD